MPRKLTTDEFIHRARQIHGELYDYSNVEYTNTHTKICIIDLAHGEFWQSPNSHLNGCGHPVRGYRTISSNHARTTAEFIKEAQKIHGNLYDYSKVNYKKHNKRICIIDSIYGEYWQRPFDHLQGCGCPDRSNNGKDSIHKDHIIPVAILGPRKKIDTKRPLYKFLNSSVNIQEISGSENMQKGDLILVNGEQMRARNVRNDYKIIAYLSETILNTNIDNIIKEDRTYCNS